MPIRQNTHYYMLENDLYNNFARNHLIFQHLLHNVTTKLEYFFIQCHLITCKENGMEQDVLIYIGDKERLEASAAANSFAHKDVKNRAYINTLGAELAMKYLVSENMDVSDVKNMHSIKKILEEIDVADILLPNIHIDVRVVFDENIIFIPKSHFEFGLTPDIYLVFNLAEDKTFVKFLGFFDPKLINKNNENSKYYFIEKEKLSPALELVNYINSFSGNTDRELSDEDFEKAENYIVSMADNDISDSDKKQLIKLLLESAQLRDKFIEYENFETLSYKAMNDPLIEKKEVQPIETFEEIEEPSGDFNLEEFAVNDNDTKDGVQEEEPESINFEELEVFEEPMLDGIVLDAVEIPQTEEVEEEPIEETLSLESVEISQDTEIMEEPVLDMLSFDEIEPLEETLIEESPADIMSFEDVEPLETEGTQLEETPDDIMSFEDIEPLQTKEVPLEEPTDDIMSFDNIQPLQTEEITLEETPDDIMPFDDVESLQTDEPAAEPLPEEELSMFFEQTPQLEDFAEIPDIIEEIEEDSSFGKNLLETLSAENGDNIEIENHDDISSQDLLSQIDDVLNTSSAADDTVFEEEMPTDSIDDILNEETDLNVLYNEETPPSEQPNVEEELPQVPGAALFNKKSTDKKSLIVAGALITILAAGSAFVFLKPKNDTTADIEPLPINNEAAALPQGSPDDILASNTPAPAKNIETKKPVVKELKNNPPKPVKSESYLDVNKLVWDVPDALSYSSKMQNYLRTAGRSIKLSLSADLLLATEYAYTNQVKVGLTLSKNGSVQDARILSGSGSTQIDNIVLQSVKDTLNVVKPPADEIKTPDFNLNLIIYF